MSRVRNILAALVFTLIAVATICGLSSAEVVTPSNRGRLTNVYNKIERAVRMTTSEWRHDCRKLGDSVICLESEGSDSGLFQVSSKYPVGGVYVNTHPRFFIWIDNAMHKVTSDYHEAYRVWNGRKCVKT